MTRAISAIYGMEPARADEYPTVHAIGSESWGFGGVKFTVTRIERREENFGDHGLVWFDVFTDDRLQVSMQGRAVAEVHYSSAQS